MSVEVLSIAWEQVGEGTAHHGYSDEPQLPCVLLSVPLEFSFFF